MTCESLIAPAMKADQDAMNKEQFGQDSKVMGQNIQTKDTVRGKTHEFGGVDCQYGVEADGAYVLYGASKISDQQKTQVEAELVKQKFTKSMKDGFEVYAATIPWKNGNGDSSMPIAFAFDAERGTWFWATNKQDYALEMLKAYRASSAS